MQKLSGPLLDRIDIHLEVPRLSESELLQHKVAGETSADIRARVVAARELQRKRFEGLGIQSNAEMSPVHIKQFCALDDGSQMLMKKAIQRLHLSARTFDRILRMARTIADLAGSETVQSTHLAESLQYRAIEKLYRTSPGKSQAAMAG